MFSDEVEDALIDLGRFISEIRFRKMPDTEAVEFLCEKSVNLRIHLDLVEPISMSEASEIPWVDCVVSARLRSDFHSDWDEIGILSALTELDITITPDRDASFDLRNLAKMQRTILNLTNLRRLVIDVSDLYPDQAGDLRKAMVFHGSDLVVSFRERTRGRKQLRRAIE